MFCRGCKKSPLVEGICKVMMNEYSMYFSRVVNFVSSVGHYDKSEYLRLEAETNLAIFGLVCKGMP